MLGRQKTKWLTGLSVRRKGMLVVLFPLLTSIFCLGVVAFIVFNEFREIDEHYHARRMQEEMAALIKSAVDIAIVLGRYHLNHDRNFLRQYDGHEQAAREALKDLQEQARGPERIHVDRIVATTQDALDLSHQIKEELPRATGLETVDSLMRMKSLKGRVLKMQQEISDFENELMMSSSENPYWLMNKIRTLMLLMGVATVINLIVALLMIRLYSAGIVNPLKTLTENTYRLSRSEELHPPIGGSDEIAHLDRVFHDMATALAEAARKERAVIQHAIDVICSLDAEGKFTAVSPASLQVWGYGPEELIGRPFTELVATADLPETEETFRRIKDEETEPQPFENRVVRKNGSVVHILWSAYWAPTEHSMFCVAHDITERKEAEEQLRASEARVRSIFEAAPVALAVIDNAGTIKLINPKAESMFGYGIEELVGKHVSLLLPRSPEFVQNMDNMVGHIAEMDAQAKDGKLLPVDLSLDHYQTADGEQYLAAILDVTERHEMERLKREFVSTVSHELRTPLTAIRGSLTLLAVGAAGTLSDQAEKMVKIAERNSLRLIALINDLLDMEKLEAGKLEMVFEDAPFEPIIERSIESVRGFAEQYGVRINAENTDASVRADSDRIVQVLVNLLSNAVKYSPRDGTVEVAVAKESGHLKVSIVDHGRGIPSHLKEKVFERFQQVEAADAKRKGGTGLGLAICKAIVEQHDGKIGVDSEEGKGSTFWFELPLAGTATAVTLPTDKPKLVTASGDVDSGHILVVSECEKVAEDRS